MKKRSYRRILILAALVLLWSALVPGVARGQEDSIVIPGRIILNNSTEAGAEGSEFGTAVAVDGSTVGVGAKWADSLVNSSGAAYLIRITASDNFPSQETPPQKKLPEEGDAEASGYFPKASDYFGYSLAMSGDALAIGAYGVDNGETDAGTAFVARFSYDETAKTYTINEWERLIPSKSSGLNDRFGYSVAISGDRAVVGTYYAEAAYVFEYEDTGWVEKKVLTAWDAQAGLTFNFGRSVAIDGDTIAVGAINGGDDGLTTGSVYVFNHDGSDWVEGRELHPEDLASNDQFGYAVALDGDTLVVGAPRHDDGLLDSGAAYVFRRNGGTWSPDPEAKLIGSGLFEKAYFGNSVALSGNTVVVGAPRNDVEANGEVMDRAGSAHIFRFDGSGWSEMDKLLVPDAESIDEFGCAVAISGDTVAVGAHRDDVEVNNEPLTDAGSVYVFTLNQPPVADAGANQEVEEGSPVTLDGSYSYDPDGDGDELSYSWTQPDGQDVDLGTADEATLTFTAPEWPGENVTLTFQLEVKDESGAASTDEVEVTVLPRTESVSEITAVLGSEHHHAWGTDKDIFNFHGTEGDKVTITLKAKTGGKNNHGDRATLKLKDNIEGVSFYRVDSGELPNQICATLPATGQYHILVAGQPRFFKGKRFLGEYTLTLEGASGSLEEGAGPPVVHNKPGCSPKPHTQHPVWSWISSWFRH